MRTEKIISEALDQCLGEVLELGHRLGRAGTSLRAGTTLPEGSAYRQARKIADRRLLPEVTNALADLRKRAIEAADAADAARRKAQRQVPPRVAALAWINEALGGSSDPEECAARALEATAALLRDRRAALTPAPAL